ncbi:hypothetical protein RhiirA1_468292 [Rhizophagus irregularis]|uniref:Uncharacterized protein n=1 Tax=Rhizophagus irregularis TaxID=588596 RepID=A0A2N0RAE4_9GLOM|nr:hypothetical protein RhiirA1_468292 [Rhizophagus irregularis]CAB4482924.1 unnamed protein product [Rhizophagus irregularis]
MFVKLIINKELDKGNALYELNKDTQACISVLWKIEESKNKDVSIEYVNSLVNRDPSVARSERQERQKVRENPQVLPKNKSSKLWKVKCVISICC